MVAIHQLLAGAGVGDAITNYAFEIQKIFKELGISSMIFSEHQHTAVEYINNQKIKDQNELESNIHLQDIIIYHYSIGSLSTDIFTHLKCRKMLCYHNITPTQYFQNLSVEQSKALNQGRIRLKELVTEVTVATAVSRYNKKELDELGFTNTLTIPLIFPTDYLKTQPNSSLINKYCDNNLNILFVGRVVPNKRFEDLIKTFAFLHKTLNPNSRLFLVGSFTGNEKYYTYLKSLIFDLNLTSSVVFSGHVSLEDLIGYYKLSNMFLCLYEHEGVGLPLIESMHFKIPVLALNKAAIKETLGGAGVLIEEMNHQKVAELINLLWNDKSLIKELIAIQNQRLEYYNVKSLKQNLTDILLNNFEFVFDK